jgi:hypothetical protein
VRKDAWRADETRRVKVKQRTGTVEGERQAANFEMSRLLGRLRVENEMTPKGK